MSERSEKQLMTRAAWFYYVGGLNQEATSRRMGLTRARVNKLLGQARETGLVSITINDRHAGLLHVEEAIQQEFGLEFCLTTPAMQLTEEDLARNGALADLPLKAVGMAGARFLREHLADHPSTVVGTGGGRTLAHLSQQMNGVNCPNAKFVSLMGSLTANSAFNPFEVVQALAQAVGGEGYFLPIPFIADSVEDRSVLLGQSAVLRPLELARRADLALISVGELTEDSSMRRQGMITHDELLELRAAGAIGDTNGIFLGADGRPVDHALNHRTNGVGVEDLARSRCVLLAGGPQKAAATEAILRGGFVRGLIIDGDLAIALTERISA
ncbi:sugar-binding transcriptional regulator [Aliiruegeria lutimaris]|nr:sugar-binding transcriptional regulator [Aliiruegeria lutimaris]